MTASGILVLAHRHLARLRRWHDVVPQTDHRFVTAVVFETEDADAGGTAEEKPPGTCRQPEPAGRDHPDDMGAGKGQDVALDAAHPGKEAVGAGCDIVRRFTAGAAVAKHFPPG